MSSTENKSTDIAPHFTVTYPRGKAKIKTLKRIDFFKDESKFLYGQLIDIEGKKYVGFQKMWMNPETQDWAFSKKSFYMPTEQWPQFKAMIREMDSVIPLEAEPDCSIVHRIPTVGYSPR